MELSLGMSFLFAVLDQLPPCWVVDLPVVLGHNLFHLFLPRLVDLMPARPYVLLVHLILSVVVGPGSAIQAPLEQRGLADQPPSLERPYHLQGVLRSALPSSQMEKVAVGIAFALDEREDW